MSRKNFPYGVPVYPAPTYANPFGETRYVAASGGDDGNYGKNASKPLATIQKAIDLSAAGDNVVLGPGTHSVDVSTSTLVPLADMQFIAAIPPMGGMPSTVITADADDAANLVTVDVDGTGWHGIKFLLVAGATTAVDLFDVAQTTAVNGLVFTDCWFDLNSVDHATAIVRAIALDDATNATTGLVIRNCRFLGGDATTTESEYIVTGVGGFPDALIEDNVFLMQSDDADAVGINVGDAAAVDKNYGTVIRNNDFIGAMDGNADSVGIKFGAQTELEMVFMIRTNYFAYCTAQCITFDKMPEGIIENYYGDNDTGGTKVDPGT
jgi:hypothetical protein